MTTTARFYAIPEHQTSIEARVAKTNKRLAAAHSETAPLRAEFTVEPYTSKTGEIYPVLVVDLSWQILSAGWTLAGVVTPTEDRTDYTYTSVTLPREAVEVTDLLWCDHCHARRYRSRLFIITNAQGDRMQVGSTCLQPHTGMRATTGMLNILAMDPRYLLDDLATDVEPDDDEKLISMGAQKHWDTEDLLIKALMVYPAWERREARLLADKLADFVETTRLVVGDKDKTSERMEQLAQIRAYAAAQAATSDYWGNVHAALGSTITGRRHYRLVVSAVSSWFTAMVKAAEAAREKETTMQEPWAPVGTKLKDNPVEVVLHRVASWETQYTYYGEVQYLYIFRTDAGHLLVWKTQKGLETVQGTELGPGARLRLTAGTVKEHGTYKGDVQTVLTRVGYEPLTTQDETPGVAAD